MNANLRPSSMVKTQIPFFRKVDRVDTKVWENVDQEDAAPTSCDIHYLTIFFT